MNKAELIVHIQACIDQHFEGNQAWFAEEKGLSTAYLNDVLRGRRDPGQKILDAIGATKIITYQVDQ